jgi:hypothetical protein
MSSGARLLAIGCPHAAHAASFGPVAGVGWRPECPSARAVPMPLPRGLGNVAQEPCPQLLAELVVKLNGSIHGRKYDHDHDIQSEQDADPHR